MFEVAAVEIEEQSEVAENEPGDQALVSTAHDP